MKPSQIKDHYERLGVSKDSSIEEIKRAYRSLAMNFHPDKNPGKEIESKLEFISISEAYDNLVNNKKNFSLESKNFEETFVYYENIFEESKRFFMENEDFFKNNENSSIRFIGEFYSKFFRGMF